MKRYRLFFAAALITAAAWPGLQLRANADPGAAPARLPDGPLLQTGAEFCAWEMDYSYPFDGAPKPQANPATAPRIIALPRRVVFTRTKKLWHGVISETDGKEIEEWFDGTLCYLVVNGQPPMVLSTVLSRQFPTLGTAGFPDLDWVSPTTYLGVQTTDGESCLVFGQHETKAWIDAASRFPVRWERGQEIRSFRPLPPPSGMLVLPAALEKISLEFQSDRELLRRPVPR